MRRMISAETSLRRRFAADQSYAAADADADADAGFLGFARCRLLLLLLRSSVCLSICGSNAADLGRSDCCSNC